MEDQNNDKRVCLGKITGAHGIKGLVKLLPYGDDVSLLETISPIFTGKTSEKTIALALKNQQGKHMLAQIQGVNDRNMAENIRGTELWVERSSLPDTDEDEFYFEDLLGMTALTSDEQKIGRVQSVEDFGAGTILDIAAISGDDFMIPFCADTIGKVDIEQKTIEILTPEDYGWASPQ